MNKDIIITVKEMKFKGKRYVGRLRIQCETMGAWKLLFDA
jgi:hypothetical protein